MVAEPFRYDEQQQQQWQMYEAIIRTYQNTQYENYTIDRNKNLIKNKKNCEMCHSNLFHLSEWR